MRITASSVACVDVSTALRVTHITGSSLVAPTHAAQRNQAAGGGFLGFFTQQKRRLRCSLGSLNLGGIEFVL